VEFKSGYSTQHYLLAVDERNVDVSTLCNICIKTRQHNFNCRTFSLIDIIETLLNCIACE